MSDGIAHDLDLERALLDPASSFDAPQDVVQSPDLSRTQKIEILCRWAYDARELAVAEEEGMVGGEPTNDLDAVVAALNNLTGALMGSTPRRPRHAACCVPPRQVVTDVNQPRNH